MNAEGTIPTFRMTAMRGIVEQSESALHVRHQIEAIEDAVYERPALVFDLSRALIETICKTILNDCGVPFETDAKCPDLLRAVEQRIQLFPSGHDSPADITETIRRTVNGLSTTVNGLCDLRSREGMASHGRDAFARSLDPVQAELAARSADTVASFLWNVHRAYKPVPQAARLRYEDNPDYNAYVDELHEKPVVIFELPFRQSDILFALDREAYCDGLNDFRLSEQQRAEGGEAAQEAPA